VNRVRDAGGSASVHGRGVKVHAGDVPVVNRDVRCGSCLSAIDVIPVLPPLARRTAGGPLTDPAVVDDDQDWAAALTEAASSTSMAPLAVARLCVEGLDVDGAGISIVSQTGVREIVCATDEVSEHLETLQFTLGVGPCVDAARQRSPVMISDLTQPAGLSISRWPTLVESVSASGAEAVFAFPLCIGAIAIGALDLYRSAPGRLSPEDLSRALEAADSVTLCLLRDGDDHATDDLGSHHFAQVHQATGMIQVQADVSAGDAFLLLRARAFASGRPVIDIARDVVERRLRFS
jgi:hypothetical protein